MMCVNEDFEYQCYLTLLEMGKWKLLSFQSQKTTLLVIEISFSTIIKILCTCYKFKLELTPERTHRPKILGPRDFFSEL